MQILEPQQFASWNEPIEMLYACHERVKKFCRQLRILPDYLEKNGCNSAVQNDVKTIINYFNIAAPLHHEDEEHDFFPVLKMQRPETAKIIEELEGQHVIIHQIWPALSSQLNALLNGERNDVDKALIEHFVQAYQEHIRLEEPLFELGRRYLTAEQLAVMGKVMFRRRQK